jgi:two-component system, OmpR family, response regulator
MGNSKILLVEDEKTFGAVLRDYLSLNDLQVTWCEDGIAGADAFRNGQFDLCIVDVMMPRKDGFTLVEEIRQKDKSVPVIFLTARSMKEDVLKGYRSGADDYITKPFDTEVLLYKIKAMTGRRTSATSETEETKFSIGKLSYDYSLRKISGPADYEVKLSPKESELLLLLCRHLNNVMPRDKALKQIWKEDNYFTARSMDVYMVKLRKYLSADGNLEITNLHSNGYILRVKQDSTANT